MKGGAQYRAVDSAVADFVIGLGNTKGVKVVERDFEGKLGVVVKSYSNVASYKGQTKDEVDDNFIYRDLKLSFTDLLIQNTIKVIKTSLSLLIRYLKKLNYVSLYKNKLKCYVKLRKQVVLVNYLRSFTFKTI